MQADRMEDMRNSYRSVPVPDELEGRVRQAIAAGRRDRETAAAAVAAAGTGNRPQHRRTAVWKRIAVVLAAAMSAVVVLANSGARIAFAMERVPILGVIVKVVEFREYRRENGTMTADVKVPEVIVEDTEGNQLTEPQADLNGQIRAYTDTIIAQYEADVKASDGQGPMALNLDYRVVTDSDRLYALQFTQTVSMADTNETVKIYNLDRKTGKILTLKDLFLDGTDYLTVLTDEIKTQMRERMQADPNQTYFIDSSDMPEFDFQKLGENAAFYVNDAGRLVIAFDKYEVAPGCMGLQEFTIPTEKISAIARPEYFR